MEKITSFLMFCGSTMGRAEEAIARYASIFEGSAIGAVERFESGKGGVAGTMKHARFSLAGSDFMAMDGYGPDKIGFTPALSFYVDCSKQAEVDGLWERLCEGGWEGQGGGLEIIELEKAYAG